MSVGRCIISRSPILLSLLICLAFLTFPARMPLYIKIGSNVPFNKRLFTSNTFIPIIRNRSFPHLFFSNLSHELFRDLDDRREFASKIKGKKLTLRVTIDR